MGGRVVARILGMIAALTVLTLLISGPVLTLLEDLAWGLDKPGLWSLNQVYPMFVVLLILSYVLFGVLVARLCGLRSLRVAAALALAAPLTYGLMRLISWVQYKLAVGGTVDLEWAVHSPIWSAYLPQFLNAACLVTVVGAISSLLSPSETTHLTSASS